MAKLRAPLVADEVLPEEAEAAPDAYKVLL